MTTARASKDMNSKNIVGLTNKVPCVFFLNELLTGVALRSMEKMSKYTFRLKSYSRIPGPSG